MSVQQIGTRLVRNFGNGDKLRTVISEVVDGKTFTKVLDKNGNVVKDRVKAFSSANVGDKLVKTRTDIYDENGNIIKLVSDRVYNSTPEKLLGVRHFFYELEGGKMNKIGTAKQARGGDLYIKSFDEETGIVDGKEKLLSLRKLPGYDSEVATHYPLGARIFNGESTLSHAEISYNNRGLPVSNELLAIKKYDNLSLKELRAEHRKIAPGKPYSEGVNLDFLDRNTDVSHNLNNLDKYI